MAQLLLVQRLRGEVVQVEAKGDASLLSELSGKRMYGAVQTQLINATSISRAWRVGFFRRGVHLRANSCKETFSLR
jgi:hypothetical protein